MVGAAGPPQSGESAQEAPSWRFNGGGLLGNGALLRSKLEADGSPFYRGLSPSRNGHNLLLILSLVKLQIAV
jgi:hypothetical protein